MIKTVKIFFLFLFLILSIHTGKTENLFGEFQRLPDTIERGFSIGSDFGILILTGNRQSAQNPGFGLSFTTGYDLFKYISLEGVYTLGINQAAAFDPVLQGGVNTVFIHLATKGQYPIGRFYPFFEIGPGIHLSYPGYGNGKSKALSILAAGGAEYYTYLRHYSLYAKVAYMYSKLPPDAFTLSAGIKYTF